MIYQNIAVSLQRKPLITTKNYNYEDEQEQQRKERKGDRKKSK